MAKDKQVMEKCNYCTESSQTGVCRWESEDIRSKHCKKALNNMFSITTRKKVGDQ